MPTKRAFSVPLIALCLVTGLGAKVSAQAAYTMKLGTATLNDGQHEYLNRLAQEIMTKTNNQIKVGVYPASQLGPIPRQIESTQLGAIQGFIATAEFYEGVDKRFQALGAAGVFKDWSNAEAVLRDPEFKKMLLGFGAQKGLRVGGLFVSGPTSFAMRDARSEFSSLQGKKIRVMSSPVQMEMVKKLGAAPLPVPLSEVLPALQQGSIDGVLSVLSVLTPMRYYEVAPVILDTEFTYGISIFVVSQMWLDQLPPNLRSVVLDSADSIALSMQPWLKDRYESQKNAWISSGGKLVKPDAADRGRAEANLAETSAAVLSNDPQVKGVFDALKSASQRASN